MTGTSQLGPVHIGNTVTARCRIDDRIGGTGYRLATRVETDSGESVIDGRTTVLIGELPLEARDE